MSTLPSYLDTPDYVRAAGEKLQKILARASDDFRTLQARVFGAIRIGSRHCRIRATRCAANTDFSRRADGDSLLAAYKNEGFNTVVITDSIGQRYNEWVFMSEEQIKRAVEQARAQEMSIILGYHANEYSYTYQPEEVCVTLGNGDVVCTAPSPVPSTIPQMTPVQVAERVALWSKYDEGDIIGVYLLGDDNFHPDVRVPAADQIAWRKAIREVNSSFPVLGMIGELAESATESEINTYFSRDAFDHILCLAYPYNLHYLTGADVNSTSPAADQLLDTYLTTYYASMNAKFFSKLYKDQYVTPVIQAFNYTGEPATKLIRARDIELQALIAVREIAKHLGREDLTACTYFHWGTSTDEPTGLGNPNNRAWLIGSRSANRQLSEKGTCYEHEACLMARYILRYR